MKILIFIELTPIYYRFRLGVARINNHKLLLLKMMIVVDIGSKLILKFVKNRGAILNSHFFRGMKGEIMV